MTAAPELANGDCALCGLPVTQVPVRVGMTNSGPDVEYIRHTDPETECGPPLVPRPLLAGRPRRPVQWPDDPELAATRAAFNEGRTGGDAS